mmetsp:Transcript_21591/g.53282  ORF Transcript_21591/g.53282 Transcript_21591/m.53282 type:complete len:279 (-) Transcript_21591:141-977(-)
MNLDKHRDRRVGHAPVSHDCLEDTRKLRGLRLDISERRDGRVVELSRVDDDVVRVGCANLESQLKVSGHRPRALTKANIHPDLALEARLAQALEPLADLVDAHVGVADPVDDPPVLLQPEHARLFVAFLARGCDGSDLYKTKPHRSEGLYGLSVVVTARSEPEGVGELGPQRLNGEGGVVGNTIGGGEPVLCRHNREAVGRLRVQEPHALPQHVLVKPCAKLLLDVPGQWVGGESNGSSGETCPPDSRQEPSSEAEGSHEGMGRKIGKNPPVFVLCLC